MSLYDDVVTDFPVAKPDIKTNNDIGKFLLILKEFYN
jgi:hypothetical protein